MYATRNSTETEHLNVWGPCQAHFWRGNNHWYCFSDTNWCGSYQMADRFDAELKYSPISGNYSKGETKQETGLSANKPGSSAAGQLV